MGRKRPEGKVVIRDPGKPKHPAPKSSGDALARKRKILADNKAKRKAQLLKQFEAACQLMYAGYNQAQAAFQAGLGRTVPSAGTKFSMFLGTPEGIAMKAAAAKEFEERTFLSVDKIRSIRAEIAKDRRLAPKDRLRACADECRTMGYDKQQEGQVRVSVTIGEPIPPQYPVKVNVTVPAPSRDPDDDD